MSNLTAARLRMSMERQQITQSELARRVGVTQGSINQILKGMTVKSKHIPDIAEALGVSTHWLAGRDVEELEAERDERPRVQIMEIDVGYGMGGGTFLENAVEATPRDFDPGWIEMFTRSSPELLFIARGIGDSMMPTLLDNDLLVVDRGQTRITQQDRIWAVSYGELGMVKRVRRKADGSYLLMSDNPQISDIEATSDEVAVVGRVVFIGRVS